MPGPLGVRCPPGTPAPRTAAFSDLQFSDLPADALGLIARKLSEGPPAEAVRHLANASMANRALRAAVAGDERLPLVRKARQLAGSLLSEDPEANQARLCLPVLGLLNPQEQAQLVGILLDREDHGRPGHSTHFTIFEEFVPQLENLNQRLRANLAAQVTWRRADYSVATAIHGLSGGLAHFDDSSIDLLLDKATCLKEVEDRAFALFGLSRELAHMKPHQRQRLLEAAQDIRDTEAPDRVNAGLCAQLKHLTPGERDCLFDWAINVPNHNPMWAKAMEGLAASAEFLKQKQKETLLTKVLDPTSDSSYAVDLHMKSCIRALAANMKHLAPDLRIQLVDGTLPHFKGSEALASLGSGLKHMAPHQQDRLLETAVHLSPREKRDLIRDFATALPSLEPASRGKVVVLMLGFDNDDDDDAVAQAIGALGPHLKYLEEDHRNTVAGRALRILNSYAARKLSPPEGRTLCELALGLGAGMGALHEDLRDALVNAVAAFDVNPDFRDENNRAYLILVKTITGVIAGLASGRQHLSRPQFKTLIDAASRLEERIEQVRHAHRPPRGICNEMKAMVIFGLATA